MQQTDHSTDPTTIPWHILRSLEGNSEQELLLALTDCDEPEPGVGGGGAPALAAKPHNLLSWIRPHCA